MVAEFNKLKQTGSYEDYVDKFEELKACLLLFTGDEFSESYFVASFISGLSDELQSFVSMFERTTLQHAIKLGKKQEHTFVALTKKLKPCPRVSNPNLNSNSNTNPNYNQWKKGDSSAGNQIRSPGQNPKAPFKIPTSTEMAARRENGLCYNCDEPFVYGHKCKKKISYMIMVEDEEKMSTHDQSPIDYVDQAVYGADVMEEVQMTLNSSVGRMVLLL